MQTKRSMVFCFLLAGSFGGLSAPVQGWDCAKPNPAGQVECVPEKTSLLAENTANPSTDLYQAQKLPAPDTENNPLSEKRIERGLSWDQCGSRLTTPPAAISREDEDLIYLTADSVIVERSSQRLMAEGAVEIDAGLDHLEADRAQYDRAKKIIDTEGNTYFSQPGIRLTGSSGHYDLNSKKGHITDVEYRLLTDNARGTADQAWLESRSLTRYDNITYTTCRPGNNAWEVQAKDLQIDQEEGLATAHHAKIRVQGVPVFYTPYLSFPIDERRRSGFLTPTLGTSTNRGTEFEIPYYFNIAPNMDATLTPRIMSDRGLLLGSEYRYLSPRHAGELSGQLVPSDSEFAGGGVRGILSYQHQGRLSERWNTDWDINYASDDSYLEDFGDRLSVTSSRNLRRRFDLIYGGNGWSFLGRADGYQTVDSSVAPIDRPYNRLPQLLLTLDQPDLFGDFQVRVDAEHNYFEHDIKVRGHRLSVTPTVSLPLRRIYGHLIPKASLNLASYQLSGVAADKPENPSQLIPSLSLDGGLIFERPLKWFGSQTTQTLEPRLFYLYTPFEYQDDLPVFDSAELDFSYSSLFWGNRFSGRDRIGDANQLTLGLTTRILDDQLGMELLRLSAGQILFIHDRKVQLSGAADEDNRSSFAGELAAKLTNNWSARVSLQWNPNLDQNETELSTVELHYQTPEQQLVNLSYRFRKDRLEDTDVSARWPLSNHWELVGRWKYSLFNGQTMEAFGGFEYRTCCWKARALVRRYVISADEEPNTAFMLQFELTGLGSLGNSIGQFLERDIYGYQIH